ncbi:MAG: DUF177 domain-containing protein [Deltaproteobacteria bacterium]|nr:DUF177 domain-containing protein [Deltaproteobacteria bacterium]
MHPVIVSVENLPPEGKAVPFRFPATELDRLLAGEDVTETRAASDLEGEARVIPSGRDVFVLGTLRGRVTYRCVRCLEPFEEGVAGDFHLVYTRETGREDAEMELRREDLEIEVLEGTTLDLAKAVGEQLFLALRPHPVCRETCKGLCSTCGGNRNLSECTCPEAPADPRFAVLGSLKNRHTG